MSLILGWRRVKRVRVGRKGETQTEQREEGKKYRANTFAIMLKPRGGSCESPRIFCTPWSRAERGNGPYVLVSRLIRSTRASECSKRSNFLRLKILLRPRGIRRISSSHRRFTHLRSMYQHRSHLKRSTVLASINHCGDWIFWWIVWDVHFAIRNKRVFDKEDTRLEHEYFLKSIKHLSIKSFVHMSYFYTAYICIALMISGKLMWYFFSIRGIRIWKEDLFFLRIFKHISKCIWIVFNYFEFFGYVINKLQRSLLLFLLSWSDWRIISFAIDQNKESTYSIIE